MLSNVSIQKYMASGDIVIEPWNDEMMDACRVSLHLGEEILVPEGNMVVDVQRNIVPAYRKVAITHDQPFRFEPGMFVLGSTFERIGLSEKIAALLDGRSTLARLGLQVTQTAMIIDAGQKPKTMTLEMYNAGPHPILLYPKMKLCRVCFFLLDPPATLRYDEGGKYLAGDAHKPLFSNEFKKSS